MHLLSLIDHSTTHAESARMFRPLDGEIKEMEMQPTATSLAQSESLGASYTLPQHRVGRSSMGTRSTTYTDGRDDLDAAKQRDSEVLMFYGIILRSQLVEMLKNKIFFDEKLGVSLTTVSNQ